MCVNLVPNALSVLDGDNSRFRFSPALVIDIANDDDKDDQNDENDDNDEDESEALDLDVCFCNYLGGVFGTEPNSGNLCPCGLGHPLAILRHAKPKTQDPVSPSTDGQRQREPFMTMGKNAFL
jgi:hypothetical protein